jgi:hypothetical protein
MALAKKKITTEDFQTTKVFWATNISPNHLALAPTRRPAQYLYDMHGVSGGTMSGIKW